MRKTSVVMGIIAIALFSASSIHSTRRFRKTGQPRQQRRTYQQQRSSQRRMQPQQRSFQRSRSHRRMQPTYGRRRPRYSSATRSRRTREMRQYRGPQPRRRQTYMQKSRPRVIKPARSSRSRSRSATARHRRRGRYSQSRRYTGRRPALHRATYHQRRGLVQTPKTKTYTTVKQKHIYQTGKRKRTYQTGKRKTTYQTGKQKRTYQTGKRKKIMDIPKKKSYKAIPKKKSYKAIPKKKSYKAIPKKKSYKAIPKKKSYKAIPGKKGKGKKGPGKQGKKAGIGKKGKSKKGPGKQGKKAGISKKGKGKKVPGGRRWGRRGPGWRRRWGPHWRRDFEIILGSLGLALGEIAWLTDPVPVEIWPKPQIIWDTMPQTETVIRYVQGPGGLLPDGLGAPYWEITNNTGDDIVVISKTPGHPGILIPYDQEGPTKIWHPRNFDFRVMTRGRDGSPIFIREFNSPEHFIEVYIGEDDFGNEILQIIRQNEPIGAEEEPTEQEEVVVVE